MKLKLKVLQGASTKQEIAIPVAKFLIGRGDECHLRPKSPAISRHHCVIVSANGQASIKDLGSKNGTFVNDTRVEGIQPIQSGDVVAFGPLSFEVIIDHTLGGVKRPKVRDISDVAERTQKDPMQDQDIAGWLEEGNVTQKSGTLDDTATRQFKLDLEKTDEPAKENEDSDDTTIMTRLESDETISESANDDEQETETEQKKKKKKKKEYRKLPPRPSSESADSQAAANDAIKRYFNRS